jgi:hypothetical protein
VYEKFASEKINRFKGRRLMALAPPSGDSGMSPEAVASPLTGKPMRAVRWLVIAAEPVTSVDVTAADSLAELNGRLRAAGVELCFAELKDPAKDKLKRFEIFSQFGEEHLFPTVDAAVAGYQRTHAITPAQGSVSGKGARPNHCRQRR